MILSTDGQTDNVKPVYPLCTYQLCWSGGIKRWKKRGWGMGVLVGGGGGGGGGGGWWGGGVGGGGGGVWVGWGAIPRRLPINLIYGVTIISANWPLESVVKPTYKCEGNHIYWGLKITEACNQNDLQNLLKKLIKCLSDIFCRVCTINPLRAKFFRGNINTYLHFMSLLRIDMTHVLKILPQVRPGLAGANGVSAGSSLARPGPTYSTESISWLLMSWRRKEPGNQQPWYWPS